MLLLPSINKTISTGAFRAFCSNILPSFWTSCHSACLSACFCALAFFWRVLGLRCLLACRCLACRFFGSSGIGCHFPFVSDASNCCCLLGRPRTLTKIPNSRHRLIESWTVKPSRLVNGSSVTRIRCFLDVARNCISLTVCAIASNAFSSPPGSIAYRFCLYSDKF